jgi:hypothetical protein
LQNAVLAEKDKRSAMPDFAKMINLSVFAANRGKRNWHEWQIFFEVRILWQKTS